MILLCQETYRRAVLLYEGGKNRVIKNRLPGNRQIQGTRRRRFIGSLSRKGGDHMINITQDTVGGLFDKYADMVYRIALNILKSREEAQDIVMESFTALIRQDSFNDENHVKAWLIRTTENKSLNVLKSSRMKRHIPLDELLPEIMSVPATESEYDLLDMVMRLPEKLRTTIYMFYYEDMTALQIAQSLGISENTVYKRLERGRSVLKINMEEDAI